jgi:hypothetical protein
MTTAGKSAKELINEHIMLEDRSLLKQTDMTVKSTLKKFITL